ncbi:hypothetical protein GCM10025865_13450 [Paraoerskovia sediminicola]|uniref:Rhodanese domain-containing protein n=1 Tax=Paraoerskovia sediminicola TaxID=1138587 RepID=A0ABM8G204_9CELL|nr:hypothetical protein GCM10025865_13450 [Paraoerskovia sediminicola]
MVGSGFGGSVAALRLAEKGYRVVVLEAGRRWSREDLPRTSWDVRKFLWAPALGCYGIQRIHLLDDVVVLAGAGVGGGSLNYANTLYEPPPAYFADPRWASITDWRAELAPHYATARRMLGVTTNPHMTPSDTVLRGVADDLGVGSSFRLTPVGVFFGSDDVPPGTQVDDPYFGGEGPRRASCTQCGSCMTGCRVGAKNTLDLNYLYLAERRGAQVRPMTTVTDVRPLGSGAGGPSTGAAGEQGWEVSVRGTGTSGRRARDRQTLTAQHVVLAAGTYGTQSLLHRMKAVGALPHLSDRLGVLTRTNSESLLGAKAPARGADGARPDFTRGVAITSSIHPEADTHVEPVRYGRGAT